MSRVFELFNIRPGEERATVLMLLHAFFMGIATTFLEISASALFLARFDATRIPFVYLGAAVASTLIGAAYAVLRRRVPFWRLMKSTLLFLFLVMAGLRLGLSVSETGWLLFGLFIWYRVVASLTDLEFWAVAARLYDVRQSKRLFGLIGSGEALARTLGSFSIPLLVKQWRILGVEDLLLVSGTALLVCLMLVLALSRGDPTTGEGLQRDATGPGERAGANGRARRTLWNDYVTVLLSLMALSVIGKYWVDFAFLHQTQAAYSGAANLAGFLGIFAGSTQVVGLLLRGFLSGSVMSRWGIRFSLPLLPVAHLCCAIAIILAGFGGAAGMAATFWLVIANQAIYKTLAQSFFGPSRKVLYQPFSSDQRLKLQILTEMIVAPVTSGVAAGAILLFDKVQTYDPVRFAYVMVATFFLWTVVSFRAYREYTQALVRAIRMRSVDTLAFYPVDAAGLAVVRERIESADPVEAIFRLSLLDKADDPVLAKSTAVLAAHPSPEVRKCAILLAARRGHVAALPEIRRCAERPDEASEVRGAAVRALALLGDEAGLRQALAHLDHPDAVIRREALVGLLQRARPYSGGIARDRLSAAVESTDAAYRVFAAEVLGEVRLPGFDFALVRLLGDPEAGVRQAALAACRGVENPAVLLPAARAFADPLLYSTAAAVFSGVGPVAASVLDKAFDALAADRRAALGIVRALGRSGGKAAEAALFQRLGHRDEMIRTQVVRSLTLCRFQADPGRVPGIEAHIRAEVALVARKLAILADLSDAAGLDLLRAALESDLDPVRTRLFHLVAFLGQADVILSARDNYLSGARERRACALEILELALPVALRPMLLAVLEDLPLAARLKRLDGWFPRARSSKEDRIAEIVAGTDAVGSSWTRAAAIHAIGALPLPGLFSLLAPLAEGGGGEPLLAETAVWTLRRAGLPGPSETTRQEPKPMHSTIERVMILKSVPVFANASEQILAGIAPLLEEVHFAAGETLFRRGDIGNSMYVIVTGRVRVHDGERTIFHLGERDTVGELAVLDPEPRSASVTAAEPTFLFRLDRDAFRELMADHPEIVQGVLHLLCQRLRRTTGSELVPGPGPV